jgi:signal transduction histidine kinase
MIEIGEDNLLYVKDNGVGLNEAQINQLFTPFKRFHAKFEGNGLGLAIVKRIIEKHGGSINIESKENQGLRVYFTLAR